MNWHLATAPPSILQHFAYRFEEETECHEIVSNALYA